MSKTTSAFAAIALAVAGFAAPLGAKQNANALDVQYVTGGMVPDTSVARAFCPAGYHVTGGGGITTSGMPAALQQSYPISDTDGTIASGPNAIGWQVAADDWSDVQAFVVCLAW
jgi:hypothetical protein